MREKVLIFVPSDNLGGAEQYLKNIASHYLTKGCFVEVRFLTQEKTQSWRGLGECCQLVFTKSTTEKFGLFSFLYRTIRSRSNTYDFLYTSHVHLTGLAGMLMHLGFLRVRKFVGRESTSIFRRFTGLKLLMFKTFYKIGYEKLDLLICQTDYMKQQLVDALPNLVSKIKIKVIPNPINIEDIKFEGSSPEIGQVDYLVSAGRLIPEKGFDILIRAFASLKNKFPGLKLVVLGEGNERANLESLCRELDVEKEVLLIGFKKNVYPYFKNAKACVVPSRIEGFPNVLLQMMSQNNAVISTLCAGGIDKIPSIYTCVPEDVGKLACEIEKSLITDNERNRNIFDDFLSERSVSNFVKQVDHYLNT